MAKFDKCVFFLIILTSVVKCSTNKNNKEHVANDGWERQNNKGKKNVLFLVSDDMRPQLNVYEGPHFPASVHPRMHTPHLDALASKSLLLNRAYVQQAYCGPSRASFLTGRRPDTTRVYDTHQYFRDVGGNYTTLPEYFKMNGYKTIGMGKVFHPREASGYDDPISWTEPYFHAPNFYRTKLSWMAVPKSQHSKIPLQDQIIAYKAIDTIKRLAESPDEPFFLAVGFHKPHMPWVFPEQFLEFYPEKDINCPDNQYAPVDMPYIAWSRCDQFYSSTDVKEYHASWLPNSTTLPDDFVKTLRRAYYSALSYADSLLGQVVKALDENGLGDNTIVSFLGDHGFELGEHGGWCKMTNFEIATHAPMMVRIPGVTDKGMTTDKLTEYVDLFPTLAEAAGLPPLPLCPQDSTQVGLCTEGTSLMRLLDKSDASWKDRVFSQTWRSRGSTEYMGYSMRTGSYRYTEWVRFSGQPDYNIFWEDNIGTELYDHETDRQENVNLAYHADKKLIVEEFSKMLHDGWMAAIPKSNVYYRQ